MELQGEIPKELGKLTTLELVDLTFNDLLSGPFPEALCELTNLNSLFLGYTNLAGELPACIGDLSKLTSFFVSAPVLYSSGFCCCAGLLSCEIFWFMSHRLPPLFPRRCRIHSWAVIYQVNSRN
jgi:hypothetical protein